MTIQLYEQDIQERAYALWEAGGRPEGSAEKDWHAAEEQLRAELDDGVTVANPRARTRPQRAIQASPSQD